MIRRKPTKNGGRRFRLIYLAPALALIALMAWALASPMGSSPDDNFHLASIWCADASKTADCQPGDSADTRTVPAAVADAPCFKQDSNISGACQAETFTFDPTPNTLTDRVNRGSYPPVYYAVMNVFVGPDILLSVFLMRLVNIVLFIGLTVALFVLLPRQRRPALLWGWIISLVPLGLFLIASNNPSAWAVIGVGTAWLALLGYFETTGWRKILLGALAAVAVLMAAGSRSDAATYAVVAIGAVLVFSFTNRRRFYLDAILPVALVVVAALFFLGSGQSSSGLNGFGAGGANADGTASSTGSRGVLLFSNLLDVQSLWAGVFGSWGLGWLDTAMPAIVSLGALACFIAVVFVNLARLSLRQGIVLAGVGLALWFVPVYVLTKGGDPVGAEVQPRYLLPLIVLLGGIATLAVRRTTVRLSRVQWILVATTLSVAQGVALYYTMRRFINGNSGGLNLDSGIRWWWDISVPPMVVLGLGTLAFAGLIFVLVGELNRRTGSLAEADEIPSVAAGA